MTFATQASAEPSSDIRLLMERPVTLLEWGMFNLRKWINKDSSKGEDIASVSYVWNENKIYIGKVMSNKYYDISTMEEAKGICQTEFTSLDNILFIKDGADMLSQYCVACNQFDHDGFSIPRVTEATEQLKERFYYSLIITNYTCLRKAYGTSISVREN
jgi:hypothetical protein